MNRGFWIFFGATVQLLFLFTVYQLFGFPYLGTGDLLRIEPLPASLKGAWRALDQEGLALRISVRRIALIHDWDVSNDLG